MMHHTINNKGFTLVETLIAVAILMVAIAGPLTIANQALTAALGSRNAMIAAYLAQDGIESLRNIKDNTTSPVWTDPSFMGGCNVSNLCKIPNAAVFPSASISACSGSCRLYLDNDKNYNYDSQGIITPFQRYFYLSNVSDSGGSNPVHEATITVVVSWKDGSIPNQIQLQEFMTDAPR